MTLFIHFFVLLPLLGFVISVLIPDKQEGLLSRVAFGTVGLHLIAALGFLPYWIFNGAPVLDIKDIDLYQSANYEFFIDFSFDKITATYLFVGAFLTFLVTVYSRYYLHREKGYKRFFNTILFFYFGYNVAVLSGNLETLFIGWEILGYFLFLLIAFFRYCNFPVTIPV